METEKHFVAVCAECKRASCVKGELYCDEYRTADITYLPVSTLKRLGREHPHYWEEEDPHKDERDLDIRDMRPGDMKLYLDMDDRENFNQKLITLLKQINPNAAVLMVDGNDDAIPQLCTHSVAISGAQAIKWHLIRMLGVRKCDCYSATFNGAGQTPAKILRVPRWLYSEKTHVSVDFCIADVIQHLWAHDIPTIGSCCGHNLMIPYVDIPLDKYLVSEQEEISKDVISLIAEVDYREWEVNVTVDEEESQ